jgi:phage terminase large subunit GpA-like protein
MSPTDLRAWVINCLAGVYQPTPTETIWEFAERTLIMPKGGENDELAGRKWTSALSPYLREVMDWFRSPGKQELFIRKSSQVGVTMAVLIVIIWHIVHRPVNIGYCIDSKEEAKKISKGRLQRWLADNKILEQMNEDEDDLANMTYYLKGMMVHFMGAYSEGAFRNKSLTIGILDELDAHPPVPNQGTTADAMRSRLKRPRHSKLLGFSSPKLETDQTTVEYLTGTQEKYHVPCPHCAHVQPFIWDRITYKGPEFEDLTGEPDLEKVRLHTYYLCELGCKIQHHEKHNILQHGVWVPTNPKAQPNKRSMQISDLYSAFVTWGDLAVEWIAAQRDPNKFIYFIQNRLGEPWKEVSGQVKEREILRLREKYALGTCPIKPILTALIVDVQAVTLKWVMLAFSSTGDMIVIDYGEALTWEEIDELLQRKIKSPFGEHPIQIGMVDEGDGKRALEVRRFTFGYDHVFPIKGRGGLQMQGMITTSTTALDDREVLTYHINDSAFKTELIYSRIKRDEKNRNYHQGRLILPEKITEKFVKELMNEVRVTEKDKYGFEHQKWKKLGDNDWLDCLKYGLAVWSISFPALLEAGLIQSETTGTAA